MALVGCCVLPGVHAGPSCLPSALHGVVFGHPEGGCECCPSSCFPCWGSLLSRQSPGHCLTGSRANTVLLQSGLLTCPDVPCLVRILISQADYDALEDKTGKYSLDKIESYFSLCELVLTPRSNPLLAVEDLYLAKQGSMTSGEFHSHILKIVKRCQFPCQQAEERAVRDTIFMGMNSQRVRDKAINLMNEEEGKQVTVEFLMNHLAVEDGNTQHKFLSQINSNSSVNMIAYDRRQNRGKSNKGKQNSGRNRAQNKTRVQTSSLGAF